MSDQLDRLRSALADRYAVEREVGAGGMASVYLARDRKHERSVAIKVLRPEPAAALGPERFLREIQVTARLHHPHILPLLDSGEADGFLYYVMPLVEGESLRDRLNREKQLPVDDAIKIAREVADALNSAHNHNVIHRDIKPENILLEEGHAIVADFGIARAVESAGEEKLTETGLAIGTPAYMSPEQASGITDLDARADIYSLGCVMYEMIVGETPYTGPTAQAIITKSMIDPVPSVRRMRETISPAIDSAITKALAKAPADRFPNATEFAEALSATAAPDVTQQTKVTRGVVGPAARRVFLASAAGIALTVIVLTAGWDRFSTLLGEGSTPVPGDKAWTIVADVDGSAAEDIRDVVRGLVSAAIDESVIWRALPAGQIQRGLARAGKPDTTTRLLLQTARELAFRGSIRTVVAPTIDRLGNTYAVTVRVVDADSGTVIAVARGSANGEDELVAALDEVVHELRRDLGERPRDIRATRKLRVAATPSFEAYRLFDRGGKLLGSLDFLGALALFREALQHDPDFASAMLKMSAAFGNLGFRDSAMVWGRRAYELPERLNPVERLVLEGAAARLRGDPAGDRRIKERIVREFHIGHNGYAILFSGIGRYEEAVAIMQEGEAMSPFGLSSLHLFNRAGWLLPLGRFDEAGGYADRLPGDFAQMMRIQIAGAATEWAVAESMAVEFLQRPDVQPQDFYLDAFTILASAHAAQGRIQQAIETLDRGTRFYAQLGRDPSAQAPRQAHFILTGAINGGMELAALPKLASGTSVREQRLAALWAAWAGDTVSATTYLRSADGQQGMPASGITSDHAQRLLLRARVAAANGRWDDVIQLLQPVATPTFARSGVPFSQLVRWTIAEAYEQIDDLDSATAYFALIASYERFQRQRPTIPRLRSFVRPSPIGDDPRQTR